MKKHELKQLIREQILAEYEYTPPSQIYGITVDDEKVKFELDEDGYLDCVDQNLKTLIVNDPRVTQICCDENQLTTLKLGRLPNLEYLSCMNNNLTSLDISNCPNLKLYYDKDKTQLIK